MTSDSPEYPFHVKRSAFAGFAVLAAAGVAGFAMLMFQGRPDRAWQAFLTNFLLFSAMAQGGLLFSVVMHLCRARWSRGVSPVAESFSAFFPVSLLLYFILFLGKSHVFPWLHHDLGEKQAWLNLPFLFSRDVFGLLVLYGSGLAYVRQAVRSRTPRPEEDMDRIRKRMSLFGVIYAVSFAVVISLLSYDLVMSASPHFVSTLFGAYSFVKAFYLGIAGIIVLCTLLQKSGAAGFSLSPSRFHDLGKLLFAFCLVWADFFYCQLVVIWYGNITEETHYLILRTMVSPWRELAWFVFIVCFVLPFIILLNRAVKTKPLFMTGLCILIILGLWLEHLLLLGPELFPHAVELPIGFFDGLIFTGFLGLMAACLAGYAGIFPEIRENHEGEAS